MIILKRILFAILAIIFMPKLSAANDYVLTYCSPDGVQFDYCINSSEFYLNNIPTKGPIQQTKELLGVPAGGYSEEDWPIYNFGNLSIETCNNKISNLVTTDGSFKTPSGIHVGLTRKSIFTKLGVYYYEKNGTPKFLTNEYCSDDLSHCSFTNSADMFESFTLYFNNEGVLSKIEMGFGACP